MKEVSLVVTHGGHGTVSRALSHGLPLLVMPMGRDQGDIAARVEASGVGLILAPTATEAEIAAAISRLVEEPQFRAAARRLGDIVAAEMGKSSLLANWSKSSVRRRYRLWDWSSTGLALGGERFLPRQAITL